MHKIKSASLHKIST